LRDQVAALNVGITIEEVDIDDLNQAIAATDNPNMVSVFNNLRNGSFNHLAAFSSTLASEAGFLGAPYEEGLFDTWMGQISLKAYPWAYVGGQWWYLVWQSGLDLYLSSPDGDWCWTSEVAFPWCYSLDGRGWFYGLP
ncbi:MAG TPA: DUF2202 domain-containing protein, partial [Oceanipulchritudo sp.]|nr:DUF2202 domain-containing protein [Oceanipulchritudo sp.]